MSTGGRSTSFEVERPTLVCGVTERGLEPGETYIATLAALTEQMLANMTPAERAKHAMGLKRVDVCMEAWDKGDRPATEVYCWWKTRVPEAGEQKQRLLVGDEALMQLLERLAEAEDEERLAFRFVLALILLRKKLLRHDKTDRREDGAWWVFTPKADVNKGILGRWAENKTIEVRDASLDETAIATVTEQLSEVLEGAL